MCALAPTGVPGAEATSAAKPATAAKPSPAPVVRRGRGNFKHQLRTEEMEQKSASGAAAALARAEEGSTIFTAATTTVVLPSSTLGTKATKPVTEEEELAAQYAHLKKGKDIPLNNVPAQIAAAAADAAAAAAAAGGPMSITARLAAVAEARAAAPRTHFGVFENNTSDTARQLLFRGEKRRRYCVIVGDLQNHTRQVTLKLFGHKGAKPFKLQNKLIRLVNLSIGKPRRGTQAWREAHGIFDDDEDAYPNEREGDVDGDGDEAAVGLTQRQADGEDAEPVLVEVDDDEADEASSVDDLANLEKEVDADAIIDPLDDSSDDEDAAVVHHDNNNGSSGDGGIAAPVRTASAAATPAPAPGDAPSSSHPASTATTTTPTPPPQSTDAVQTAEARAFQNQTHAAAGFDVEEEAVRSSRSSSTASRDDGADAEARQEARRRKAAALAEAAAAVERAAAAVPIPESDNEEDEAAAATATAAGAATVGATPAAPVGLDAELARPAATDAVALSTPPPPAFSADALRVSPLPAAAVTAPAAVSHVDPAENAAAADADGSGTLAAVDAAASTTRAAGPPGRRRLTGGAAHDGKAAAGGEAEGEDVDHYLEDDEVVPLTVQQAGTGASVMYETSLANSPVLTAKRFNALRDYFLREFRFLLNLEDVRTQHVSVKINLGAAYCCLARQGSYSTPLKHATFGEFVERMNAESMQLYFIKDCPACVSRAVDMESGSLHFPASSTTVKINFFSNERQSRSIARAVWDSDVDQFRLLDVENIGVAFNWSVFSLDETFVRRKNEVKAEEGGSAGASAAVSPAAGAKAAAPAPPPAVAPPVYSTPAHVPPAMAARPVPTASMPAAPAAIAEPAMPKPPAPVAAKARMGPAPVGVGMDLDSPFRAAEEPRPAAAVDAAETGAPAALGAEAENPRKVAFEDDDEDDLARNKTVAYPFEVEFRAYRRWKQQADNPAAPLAKAILEELSLAEHNYLLHGSTAMYERMDLTNVCEVDYAAEDLNVESIVVEHTSRVKPEGTDLLVDNTTSLFIENFAAARQLKEKVNTYGPVKVAAMQNTSNNNFMRSLTAARRAAGRSGGHGARDALHLTPAEMAEVLKPTSKLTFFRSRGSSIHWKLRPNSSLEENIAPMTEALSFLQQVLHTANEIERNSARGGAAPEAV